MQRRDFLKKSILGTSALLLSNPLASYALADDTIKITILHTNDMHSRIDPFPVTGGKYDGMGGMANRAMLIKRIRNQEKNVLLLDAGDIFQGTPYFNFYGGELEYTLMSKMQYDAATLGNHDFDNGIEGFLKQLPLANFPFLIANYDFSKTDVRGKTKPYHIFEKEGIKIGVFGLGIELEGLVPEALYGATVYQDPIPVAKEMVSQLKSLNCDLIVCLSHLGFEYKHSKVSDKVLASKVDGIDLIIGGHTHTFLDKPIEVKSNSGHTTIINQVGWAGINLGRIDFYFSKKKKKKVAEGMAIGISDKTIKT